MEDSMSNDYLKLLESGELADAEIICKERVWKVHTIVLCARSKWCKRAFTGNWKGSSSRKVRLDDADARTLDIVLRYLYGGGKYIGSAAIKSLGFGLLYRVDCVDVDMPPACVQCPKGDCKAKLCSSRVVEYDKLWKACSCETKDECCCLPLDDYISIWLAADYLILEGLMSKVLKELREIMGRIISDLFLFKRRSGITHCKDTKIFQNNNIMGLLEQLEKAIDHAYTVPEEVGKRLQLLLVAFVIGIKQHMPQATLHALIQRVPAFKEHMTMCLLQINFNYDCMDMLGLYNMDAKTHGMPHVREWSISPSQICPYCEETISSLVFMLDPFSDGWLKGCSECRDSLVADQLENCLNCWDKREVEKNADSNGDD